MKVEKVNFTVETIERIRSGLLAGFLEPSPGKPAFADKEWPGLKLRTSSRALTFVAQVYEEHRGERQSRYRSIAKHPLALPVTLDSLKAVREEFEKAKTATQSGDTGALIDAAREKREGNSTLAEMAAKYFDLEATRELKTFTNRRRTILKLLSAPYQGSSEERERGINARKSYGELRLSQISAEGATNLYAASGPLKSRHHNRAAMNAMFAALQESGFALTERNPFRGVGPFKGRKKGQASPRQDDHFTPKGLRDFFGAVDSLFADGEISYGERDFIYFLALAPRRRGEEVVDIKWREVDFGGEVLNIPAGRTKNSRPFDQPLSAPLLAMVRRRKEAFDSLPGNHPAREERLVFWNRKGGTLDNFTRLASKIDARLYGAEGKARKSRLVPKGERRWRYHDFRRTAPKYMEDAFEDWLPNFHDKLLLGHALVKSSSALAAYTAPKMRAKKRHLFDYWAMTFATLIATTADEFPTPDQRNGAEESLQAHVRRDGQNHLQRLVEKLA